MVANIKLFKVFTKNGETNDKVEFNKSQSGFFTFLLHLLVKFELKKHFSPVIMQVGIKIMIFQRKLRIFRVCFPFRYT